MNSFNIDTDTPQNKIAHDDYCRKNLVELISNSIIDISRQEHPSISYGVFAKWGVGKTTVLNFVEEKLLTNNNDKIIIVHFNPWVIGNEEDLIRCFFESIVYKADDKLKQAIIKYASLFSYTAKYIGKLIPIPGVGDAISNFANDTKAAVQGYNKSIWELKEEISQTIIKSKKHLLVIIDDIDRLDNNEIHSIFRLVRQIADFKNTIYLLAMDNDIVSKALGKFIGLNNDDGASFLDKIIQIPIVLPTIPQYLIQNKIESKIKSIFGHFKIQESTKEIAKKLSNLIKTPRQLSRLFNQLYFVLPTLYEEVNIEDLCYLETIKLISVQAYQKIYDNKDALLRKNNMFNVYLDNSKAQKATEERYKQAIDSILQSIPNDIHNNVHDILITLFPNNSNSFNYMKDFVRKSISNELFFSTYFIQNVPYTLLSRKVINDLEGKIDFMSEKELTDWINNKYKEYDAQNIRRALEFVLFNCENFKLRCGRMEKAIMALCQSYLSDDFNYTIIHNSITDIVICDLLRNYAYEITSHFDNRVYNDDVVRNILQRINKTASIQLCMHLNATITHSYNDLLEYYKPSFDFFRTRFLNLPFDEQTKYCSSLLRHFFHTWNSIEPNGSEKYLRTAMCKKNFNPAQFLYAIVYDGTKEEYLKDFNYLFGNLRQDLIITLEKYKNDPKYENTINALDRLN